jgi:hypothetical protein
MAAALGVAALFMIAPAIADEVKYHADLAATAEVPPNASKGLGGIDATVDTTKKSITWSGYYSDLTGKAIAAHFHGPAAPGENAPVVVPVDAATSPFKGNASLTDDQLKLFADGKIYFNIHTPMNKGGEIRGQLAVVN